MDCAALHAAAFQDHLARQLCFPQVKTKKQVKSAGRQQHNGATGRHEANNGRRNNRTEAENGNTRVDATASLSTNPPVQDHSCPLALTSDSLPHSHDACILERERERELIKYEKSLSLAERLHLVDRPPAPLSAEEWENVKRDSDTKKYSSHPCAICMEDFTNRKQLILSCGHVFHQVCFDSFVKFARMRQCPLCRLSNPYVREHDGGRAAWERGSAVKIQAAWRGYAQRKETAQLLKALDIPDQCGLGGVRSVRRFSFFRLRLRLRRFLLGRFGCRVCASGKKREDAVESLLRDIDENVQASTQQMREAMRTLALTHGREPSIEAHVWGEVEEFEHTEGRGGGLHGGDRMTRTGVNTSSADLQQGGAPLTGVHRPRPRLFWGSIKKKALERLWQMQTQVGGVKKQGGDAGEEKGSAHAECAICFQDMAEAPGKTVALLSCSHLFHNCCIANFESFHIFEDHRCPMCRTVYERKAICLRKELRCLKGPPCKQISVDPDGGEPLTDSGSEGGSTCLKRERKNKAKESSSSVWDLRGALCDSDRDGNAEHTFHSLVSSHLRHAEQGPLGLPSNDTRERSQQRSGNAKPNTDVQSSGKSERRKSKIGHFEKKPCRPLTRLPSIPSVPSVPVSVKSKSKLVMPSAPPSRLDHLGTQRGRATPCPLSPNRWNLRRDTTTAGNARSNPSSSTAVERPKGARLVPLPNTQNPGASLVRGCFVPSASSKQQQTIRTSRKPEKSEH
uniref:RING-type domain-containing protein n=1 Tax=Chromera velia CCMP2878 TaxID=1169474 RepID=A0A0G4HCD7_9ALVE|eukprot:Cvel_26087.t1-p1 / transcript=Cvel_26087.t1 / gene=Cvel_26087 / organism=Chromera_velia_CCMP2878 / gene_product=RING finger protein 32, putative / transcript_product=RING finger protein 32, putative / location=Cvel_scaffold3047:9521-13884(+) / protein_length=736 / sequence_SO=supercontig / SO=protein_coding / is_pseudo=false